MLCTLLLPELFLPRALHEDACRGLSLPALELLLSRAGHTALSPQGYEDWLCHAFKVASQPDLPVAPLTLAADGGDATTGYWLRADPVHLEATRDRVLLIDATQLAIRSEEAAALVEALNGCLAQEGRGFLAPRPDRWYLHLTDHPQIATRTLPEAIGRDIRPLLAVGPEALLWHRLTNEVEMLLHAHVVNEARDARGEPTINSIWLWGGGFWPEVSPGSLRAIWSADPLARGLAKAAKLDAASIPENAAHWLNSAGSHGGDGDHLVVLDQLLAPARHGDVVLWRERFGLLEEAWFAPLLRELRAGRIAKLSLVAICAERCSRFDITPRGLLRFWRTRPRLASYATGPTT